MLFALVPVNQLNQQMMSGMMGPTGPMLTFAGATTCNSDGCWCASGQPGMHISPPPPSFPSLLSPFISLGNLSWMSSIPFNQPSVVLPPTLNSS